VQDLFLQHSKKDFVEQNDQSIVRILDNQISQSIFWKTNVGTWFERDPIMVFIF
jgi:hypothetical protein